MDVVDRIEGLFAEHGGKRYDDARAESVSALAHALQCAQFAEWAGARAALVTAAFLHDVGHFLADEAGSHDIDDVDDAHERRAVPLLRAGFDADVIEPIRLHVEAKRYLVFADPGYRSTLSPASIHSLVLQGGPMTAIEAHAFEDVPFWSDAVALRRWDDLAKDPQRATPPLSYYLALIDEVRMPGQATRAPRA